MPSAQYSLRPDCPPLVAGRWTRWIAWPLQIVAAVILGQTLWFKLSAAPESVYIFSTLGAEPWGRIGTAVAELLAVCLLLAPRTAALGAALTVMLMLGALGAHLSRLGIVVHDDGGLLFALALTALLSSGLVVALRRGELLAMLRRPGGQVAKR